MHRADLAPAPADIVRRPWVASLGSERSAATPAPSWPADEVAALRRAVAADVPVLGLCFGGQALCLALGGRIERAEPPEIGTQFHPEATPAIVRRWAALAAEALPPGITAEELARQSDEMGGDDVRAQAFRLFDAWWALREG